MRKKKRTYETTEFSLSFSSIEILNQCPRKWYLRYIKNIYPDTKQDHSDFGSFVHSVAENYEGGGYDEIKELCNIFKEEYKFDRVAYKDRLKLAMKNLVTFYKIHLQIARKIYNEKEIRFPLNKIFDLSGKIDLLYSTHQKEWIVVDYKTSKKKKDQSKQLASYFFMLKAITKKSPKKIKAKIVYLCLEDGSDDPEDFIDDYVIDMEDYSMIDSVLKSTMRKIENLKQEGAERWRKKCGPLCDYCDYKISNHCDGIEDKTKEEYLQEVCYNV